MHHLQLLLNLLDLGGELAQDVVALDQVVKLLRCQTTLLQQILQPVRLLLHVSRVRSNLLKHLDVVLCVLIGQTLGRGDSFLRNGSQKAAAEVLGYDTVESGNGAGGGIEAAACGTVSAGLLVDVCNQGLLGAATLVRNSFGGTLGEELDGGVGLDALVLCRGLCVWCFGVNLGDQDSGLGLEVVGELLPDRSQRFAVCKGGSAD